MNSPKNISESTISQSTSANRAPEKRGSGPHKSTEHRVPLWTGFAIGTGIVLGAVLVARADPAPTAHAVIRDAAGKSMGVVRIQADGHGTRFQGEVSGLTPGEHGFHVHETGKCEAPDFKTAGAHFAPGAQHHGLKNRKGPHGGDFPNLKAGADGVAQLDFKNARLTLGAGKASLLKDGATSIVVHAKPDDQKSDPAGASGDRIACGVIVSGEAR